MDTFLRNRQRHSKEQYDANAIMKMLVFSRWLYPVSKRKTHENRHIFFEKFYFSLDDIYRCLTLFNKHSDALQLWLHERIKDQYNRNTDLVYYDVTNFYFEIDEQDDLRKKGVSKEYRPDPVIQMGLFMDTNGIPIIYKLFSGNAPDKTTLIPALGSIQIDAHFLTYFISLVIVRIFEYRLKGKFSIPEMLESLSRASCSHIQENYYLFNFYNNVLEDIHS